MRQPVYNNYQFIDATVLNDGATELLQSTQEIGQFLHDPGLVSPQDVAFAFNNTLQVSVTTASGFAVLFGDGLVVQGLGTANNTVNNVYSVDFAPLVPVSGSVTAYVIASVATIGFNPYIVVGPPVGHPDYNPAFNPYTAYAENRYTLNIVASTTPPDNLTTFSLGQTTLNAGQTGITSLTYTWQYVNSVLRPTGVVAGSYPVATVNVDANGRILSASQTPNVGFTNQANSWSGNQAVSGSVSATTGFSTPANVTCAAASTAGQAVNLGQAFKLLQPTASQSITPAALTTVVEPGSLTAAITLTINPGTVLGQKITIYGAVAYPVTISSSVSSGSPYFLDVTSISFYSWTIGAGFPSQFIELTWDGFNWKFVSGGKTVVADAVANNQAVNLGQFPATLSGSGYQKLPNGYIRQWLVVGTTIGATTAFTWPIVFPNGPLSAATSDTGAGALRYGVTMTAAGGNLYSGGGTAGLAAAAYIEAIGN